MKQFWVICVFLILSNPIHASCAKIESIFEENVNNPFILTHVPRGVIASFDEDLFFDKGEYKIKPESVKILDDIGKILNQICYTCVIEGHTTEINKTNGYFNSNWELSLARANTIARYLIMCAKVPADRIFSVGFGESMVLEGHEELKNRIDIVIINYEY